MTEQELLAHIAQTYPESAAIVVMARGVWAGSVHITRTDFTVSLWLRLETQRLLGHDIETAFITDSDMRHIKKKHGQNEAARGQADITPDDFALVPYVLNEFDTVEHTETDKLGNKKILFSKRVDGFVFLATVERGDTRIQVKTFWKMRNAPGQVPRAGPGT
ncbi:MAG: PBECR3 family protein [Treponematales bacterium]